MSRPGHTSWNTLFSSLWALLSLSANLGRSQKKDLTHEGQNGQKGFPRGGA